MGMAQWEAPAALSLWQQSRAQVLAQAVKDNPQAYIEQYRSNSHFQFGEDDPFHYYMPESNEADWLRLQQFEWDQTDGNVQPYVPHLQKLEAALAPLSKVDIKTAFTAALGGRSRDSVVDMFKVLSSVPANADGVSKCVAGTPAAKLAVALGWANLPQVFSQFIVKDGALDSFVGDNAAAFEEGCTKFAAMQKTGTAFSNALTKACTDIETACKAKNPKVTGVKDFLLASGLAAAAQSPPSPHWLATKLRETATDNMNKGSFMAMVHCETAAAVVEAPGNAARQLHDLAAYGQLGGLAAHVSQECVGRGYADGVVGQLNEFLYGTVDPADIRDAVSKALGTLEEPAKALNEAKAQTDGAFSSMRLDYAMDTIGSLSIQYKY